MHRRSLARRSLSATGVLLLAAALPVAAQSPQILLRQTVLGPMPTDSRAWSIAGDAGRVALAANSGSRQQVFIDGNPSALYDGIEIFGSFGQGDVPRLILISPDDQLVAYVAQKNPGEVAMVVNNKEGPAFERIGFARFSPTGHHLVYTASKSGHTFVVFDGNVSPGYRTVMAGELRLSDDGQHIGYPAQTDDGKRHVVVDGKESAPDAVINHLWLGHNGRAAYAAQVSNQLGDNHMVIDDKPGPKFAILQAAVFSADGAHVGYVGQSGERSGTGNPPSATIIDGQVGPEYQRVDLLTPSPDGKRWAYRALETSGRRVSTYAIVDGQKSADYDDVHTFIFSSDGRHLAYIASKRGANGPKDIVVLDGQEQTPIEQVDPKTLTFSPDANHLGYAAREGSYGFAVIDGKKGPPCGAIDPRTFEWQPALGTFWFKTRGSTSDFNVWIGTEPVGKDGAPAELAVTPDGKHRVEAFRPQPGTAQQGMRIVLDGKPVGEDYGSVDQLQISPDGAHVAFLAGGSPSAGKKGPFVVHDGQDGPSFFRINKVVLSPDGQHVAYDASEDGTKNHVVVDSIVGPTYQAVPLGFTSQMEAMQFRPDGSLVFLAVIDGKMNRMVYPAESLRAIPHAPSSGAAASSPGYTQLYGFGKVPKDGAKPKFVAVASDGSLFGVTTGGGKYAHGVLFKMRPDGSDYTILHNFAGGRTDGNNPTSLIAGPDGAAYGSLMDQGPSGQGLIFRCASGETDYKVLHAFNGSANEGSTPVICAIDPDGTLYGIVKDSPFSIFRLKSDGSDLTLIYKPKRAQGRADAPGRGLITHRRDGFFYGVNRNSIYKLKKDGSGYAIVREFQGNPVDINSTDRAPIVGPDGALYGFATNGGPNNTGVIFRLNKDGSDYKIIVNPEGEQLQPHAIADGGDGKIYMLARQGLCRVNGDGSGMEVLQPMEGGSFPPCLIASRGALYSANVAGGNGGGIVFRYGLGGGNAVAAQPRVVVQNVPPTPLEP